MLPAACVAIHVIASAATPVDTDALLARCNGILGDAECRVVGGDANATDAASSPDATGTAAPAPGSEPERACWQATVTLDEKGTRAVVVLRGASDEQAARRDVRFESRDQITDRWATLGLVVAALVTVEEHSGAAETPTAPPPAPAVPPVSRSPSIAPRPVAENAPSVEATFSGVAGAGFLPGAALGLRLEAAMYIASFGVLVRGAYTPPRSEATVPVATGTGGGRFSAWALGVAACGRTHFASAWTLRGCVGGDVDATTATGFGAPETTSATALMGVVWLGPAVTVRLAHHVAVTLETDALIASQRPDFSIRGASTVFTPSRFGADVALGLTAMF
jgi:hypothetical protein